MRSKRKTFVVQSDFIIALDAIENVVLGSKFYWDRVVRIDGKLVVELVNVERRTAEMGDLESGE